MPNLSTYSLPGPITRGAMELYEDYLSPDLFFSSLATDTFDNTLAVSVATRRFDEAISEPIIRGMEGRRNQVTKHTVNMYKPPFYDEKLDVLSLGVYDRLWNQEEVSATFLADLYAEAAEESAKLIDKIKRAKEKQWANVFETGVVPMIDGANIDYRRKAESIVDTNAVGGGYWDAGSTNIAGDFTSAGDFMRQEGKALGNEFNVVMGQQAFNKFLNSTEIVNASDTRWVKRIEIDMAGLKQTGAVPQGTYSAGSYKFYIWTYPEIYDTRDAAGAVTRNLYWSTKKVLVIPVTGFNFKTRYAAVPHVVSRGNSDMFPRVVMPVRGDYHLYDLVDDKRSAHELGVRSAPLAVPVSVDQIYTMTVLA